MNPYASIWRSIGWRSLLALPLFAVGLRFFSGAADGGSLADVASALAGIGCFLAGAVVVAPGIAALFAEPLASIYMPSETRDKPPPMYGIADARRANGRYEAAMEYLEAILRNHPQELKAYLALIEVAALDLKDKRRARHILARGLASLTDPGDRAVLKAMHEAIVSRLQSQPAVALQAPPRVTGKPAPEK